MNGDGDCSPCLGTTPQIPGLPLVLSLVEGSRAVTPLKPRIRPVVPPSVISPVELLPSLASNTKRLSTQSDHYKCLCDVSGISPLVDDLDDLSFSSLSLTTLTPPSKLTHLDLDSDLHVGFECHLSDATDTPPLRTPFHPNSSSTSPDTLIRFDFSAFPIFDARTGPTVCNNTVTSHVLPPKSRPAFSRRTSLDSVVREISSHEVSPSIPSKRPPLLRHSTATYRPSKVPMKHSSCALSSISETVSTRHGPATARSPAVQFATQQSRILTRRSLTLHRRTSTSIDDDNSFRSDAAKSPVCDRQPLPYDSTGERNKSHRPTMVPGFLQSLPPFRLPTSPSLASPICISPVTPSRCTTPLKSPFFLGRKYESNLRWKCESSDYFYATPV
ncbi:hypothetical protein C8R42DRAFT_690999 [Lentinula raphanica]|nr:hypothetical protein C8R42DRAFT_690999 [Lentinula raphanica]